MTKNLRDIQCNSGHQKKNDDGNIDKRYSDAKSVIDNIIHNDILIASLPLKLDSESNQILKINELIKQNAKAELELKEAKQKARNVQKLISKRLESLSNEIYALK